MIEDAFLNKLDKLADTVKSDKTAKDKKEKVYSTFGKSGYKKIPPENNFDGSHYRTKSNYLSLCPADTVTLDDYEKGQVLKLATDYMAEGCKKGSAKEALTGFRLYSNLGLANRTSAKKRLLKAFEADSRLSLEQINQAKTLLNFSEHMKKERNSIEKRVLTSIFGIATIAGILFGLNSITGAAIGFFKCSIWIFRCSSFCWRNCWVIFF